MIKSLSALAALALSSVLAAQTTYYVDANNGVDTNTGLTPSAAFKSMTQAATVMVSNDTLMVLPGVYDLSVESSFPVNFGNTAVLQDNITIIGAEGPTKTFLDGSGTYDGIGMIRFRENARGARLTGMGFRNMLDSFWSCGIRLGSSSGNQFRCWDVEVDNCIFYGTLSRAFVLFGGGAGTRQSTGCRIHDNLMINMHDNRRSVEIDGDGDNHFYNNTILHTTNTTNRASIYTQSIDPAAHAACTIRNNVLVGGGTTSWGIEQGVDATNITVEFNNSFGHFRNYVGFTAIALSNTSVDPEFVDAANDDYHLKSTSPMIDSGTMNVPLIRKDLDGFPHLHGAAPDKGAYESHDVDMQITAPPVINGIANFAFTGGAGIGGVFLGFEEESIYPTPFGVVLIDTMLIVGTTSAPGNLPVPVPNLASAEGLRVTFQGAYQDATSVTLLNAHHSYVRL